MREYRGRKVLRHLTARIIPQRNSTLPDSICHILLTEYTLYVLEGNYDGTYITHFEIPCSHIKRIEKYKSTDKYTDGSSSAGIAAIVGLLFGAFDTYSSSKAIHDKIFTVILHGYGGLGEGEHISFGETVGSIKGFIKAFEKLKSRN